MDLIWLLLYPRPQYSTKLIFCCFRCLTHTFLRLGRPATKFRANRSFREVMTFRTFSKWLPSAILNFEKFNFWINVRGRSQNLRRHTTFGQNRMIGGRNIAIKPKSNMATAAMLNLLPVYFLTHYEDNGRKMCLHAKFHANRTIAYLAKL